MSKLKKVLSFVIVVLIFIMEVPLNVSATEDTWNVGDVSNSGLFCDGFEPNLPEKIQTESSTDVTLSKYDPRTTASITPVKGQGNIGACWAFATIAQFE